VRDAWTSLPGGSALLCQRFASLSCVYDLKFILCVVVVVVVVVHKVSALGVVEFQSELFCHQLGKEKGCACARLRVNNT